MSPRKHRISLGVLDSRALLAVLLSCFAFPAAATSTASLKNATLADHTDATGWSDDGQLEDSMGLLQLGLTMKNAETLEVRSDGKQAPGSLQMGACVCCIVLVGLTCLHEAWVCRQGELPLSGSSPAALAAVYLLWWFMVMMDSTTIIPTSLSMATEMGSSSVESGILISCGYLMSPVGSILAAFLIKTLPQGASRLLTIFSTLALVLANLMHSLLLDSSVDHAPRMMWFLIGVRVIGGIGKVNFLIQFMAFKVTSKKHLTYLSIATACVNNLGLAAGPLLSSLVSTVLQIMVSPSISSYAMNASPVYIVAVLWSVLMLAFSLVIPVNLKPWIDLAAGQTSSAPGAAGDSMTLDERKAVVVMALLYAAERGITVSAIEAGSAMLLEVEFGWTAKLIGFCISGVFLFTALVAVGVMLVKAAGWAREVPMLLACVSISAFGALLLPNYVQPHTPYQIIFADAVIYPFAYSADGLSSAIAAHAVIPNSSYDMDNYLKWKIICGGLTRFAGAPTARVLIELGGRNIYAFAQISLGVLGIVSAAKIASITGLNGKGRRPPANEVLDSAKGLRG